MSLFEPMLDINPEEELVTLAYSRCDECEVIWKGCDPCFLCDKVGEACHSEPMPGSWTYRVEDENK